MSGIFCHSLGFLNKGLGILASLGISPFTTPYMLYFKFILSFLFFASDFLFFIRERKYKLDLVKRDCHFNNFVIIASI